MDTSLESVVRMRAYEAAAVAEFLQAGAEERHRLLDALDTVNARIETARARLVAARGNRDHVGTMVLEAERRHRQLEADTARAVEELLEAADAEACVCVAAARAEVARNKLAVTVRQVSEESAPVPAGVIDLSRHRTVEVS